VNILGISAYYHDAAAAILVDGKLIAAAQEERFSRKKHDARFPVNAIRYCLKEAGLDMSMVDQVAFYDKPFLKFERLLETYYNFAPRGLISFVTAIPVWVNEKLFLKRNIRKGLKEIGEYDARSLPLFFPEHHLSHAASAFYPSPFQEAVIVTVDGVGEWATASVCTGKGNSIRILKELRFPHSVGLLYSAFTYFLGFRVNSGEYKMMGLAPYGHPRSQRVEEFVRVIGQELVKVGEDGSIWLNQKYFRYATGLRMINHRRWKKLFGIPRRREEEEIRQVHCDLALAIQRVTEQIMMKMVTHAKDCAESEKQAVNLCLAGGVALNCVANGKIKASGLFRNIFVQPAAGDAGGALGAALAVHHIYHENERRVKASEMTENSGCMNGSGNEVNRQDAMQGAFLGPSYPAEAIREVLAKFNGVAGEIPDFNVLGKETARLIADGHVVGWFQGRLEFGPRALGNRSILADARNPEMQKKLNLKVKYREGFRPFAPAVRMEDVADYFEFDDASPYMLMVAPVLAKRRRDLPDNYYELPHMERLYVPRSDLPAITHIDFSARLQTVHRETNPRFWQLIGDFKELTGCGVLINTSFNVRGEPVVCSPEDAYRCFMRTEMDYLVMGSFLCKKQDQPPWNEKGWRQKIGKD